MEEEDPYAFITKNSLIPPHIEEKLKRTPFAREGEVFTSPSYYHPNFKWPTVSPIAPIPAAVVASPIDVGQCSTNMQAEVPRDINVIDISSSTDEEEEEVEYELIDVEDEEDEEEEVQLQKETSIAQETNQKAMENLSGAVTGEEDQLMDSVEFVMEEEDPYAFITKNSLCPPHIQEKLKRTPFAREGEVFTSPSYYHPNFKWPTVAPIAPNPAPVVASPVDVGQCSTNMQAEVPKDINVIDISSSTDEEEEEVVEYELIDVEDEEDEEEEVQLQKETSKAQETNQKAMENLSGAVTGEEDQLMDYVPMH